MGVKGKSDSQSGNEVDEPSTNTVSITRLLNVSHVLPGESVELYQASLNALINELEAKTVMQVYLAEKIHECLWWMRRYDHQKRVTLAAEMASVTHGYTKHPVSAPQAHVRDSILANKVDKKTTEAAKALGHTMESLQQLAFERRRETILQLDQQIALQAKILAGFQASYEVAVNRKLNIQRLQLQNEMMRRDLDAIEGVKDDQPKAATGKSP